MVIPFVAQPDTGVVFGIDYDADEDAVDEDTMDARIDFYVSTVMDHVMQKEKEIAGETGKIVYAWDVVNEYLHRGRAWSLNWTSVYGDMKGTPSYVKRAFWSVPMRCWKNMMQQIKLHYFTMTMILILK